jgi:GT2 family glycosyltransferase
MYVDEGYIARQLSNQFGEIDMTAAEAITDARFAGRLEPSPYFDSAFYRSVSGLDFETPLDALVHYREKGWKEGYDPNPYFSTEFYLSKYRQLLQKVDCPLDHFIENESDPDLQVGAGFSSKYYLRSNRDVAAAKLPPFYHFLRYGRLEGREPISEEVWQDPFADQTEMVKQVAAAYSKPAQLSPVVSVIIPVFNQFSYTVRCLWSIAVAGDATHLQIIIADDCSSDESEGLLSALPGITYIRNEKNLGFLNNCNKAAEAAEGKYLFFLNNDTAVLPGWIDHLVATASNISEAGLIGSKLLYPDGTLQEAGGIIWRDASGANVGRLDDPRRPDYNYMRDVDYVSGAAIMVPKTVWTDLGGFDERFAPAYYEDTDLAFRIRNRGLRVLYQPLSRVIHFEGITSGRDLSTGVKSHQVTNAKTFHEKWVYTLEHHLPSQKAIGAALTRRSGPRLLVVDHMTPRPDHDAGSVIAWHFLKIFIDLGYHVTFVPCNLVYDGQYTKDLQGIGVECIYRPFVTNIDDYLWQNGERFDGFFLSRVDHGGRYSEVLHQRFPNKPIIF